MSKLNKISLNGVVRQGLSETFGGNLKTARNESGTNRLKIICTDTENCHFAVTLKKENPDVKLSLYN